MRDSLGVQTWAVARRRHVEAVANTRNTIAGESPRQPEKSERWPKLAGNRHGLYSFKKASP